MSLIIILGLGAVFMSIMEAVKHRDKPIHVADFIFVAFLPFLITFGFYVFYQRSLSGYIYEEGEQKINLDESSKLLNLTKKLFVSSLICYLFIEILKVVEEYRSPKSKVAGEAFDSYVDIISNRFLLFMPTHPTYQILIYGLCIVMLLAFYVLLNKHKSIDDKTNSRDH